MKKILLITLALLFQFGISFAAKDTLWVEEVNLKPHIKHTITNNQSIFTLSKMYNVNVSVIADVNNKTYQKGFQNGDIVYIPITNDNYASEAGELLVPIYYRVKDNESLIIISKWINVRQSMLQTWNQLATPQVSNGQIIVLGWVKHQKVTTNKRRFDPNYLPDEAIGSVNQPKTSSESSVSPFQQAYESENESEETEIRGPLTFYKNKAQLKEHVYYAFHNSIPTGTIVKIINPANNKMVFAKIISKLPQLEEYQNSIIAISDNAYSILDAKDARIFCNIFYKLM